MNEPEAVVGAASPPRPTLVNGENGTPIASPLMSFEDAADYLNVAAETLRHWLWRAARGEGDAPRSYKLGRHRRFKQADLDRFIEERAEEPTS